MSVRALLVCAAVVTAGAIGCATQTDTLSISSPDARSARAAPTTGITVTTVVPSQSPQGITLNVQVNGTGFDNTSQVTMPLNGVIDPRVHVNKTSYVTSTQVVANVTISSDAVLNAYDVVVATASGKKGIGTEAFVVVIMPEVLAGGYHVKGMGVTGDAVGDATNPVSCNAGPLPTLWHPDGSRVTLPTGPTYCGGSPQAINASGVILGSLSGGPANSQGMWFPSGGSYTLQVLPPAPDGVRPITAGALNDNNEVFGWGAGVGARLYWWSSATGWLSVQVPANATACQSFNGINNRGELVAKCTVGGVGNGYYWSSHSAAPQLLPRPSGTGDVSPRAINDGGVIVGNGPGGGLRWQPTPSGYVVNVFPGTLDGIASDGTMSGSIVRTNKSSSRSPVIFYSPTSYEFLGLTSNGSWGEAVGIALTPNGIVAGGTEGNTKALRWRKY